MGGLPPRAVVVTRESELDGLLAEHGTRRGAAFFLESRGLKLRDVDARHALVEDALSVVLGQIPLEWRRARVARPELDRFMFQPEDVVVTVGQDGLVANVAKYVEDQVVIGINPGLFSAVLAPHSAKGAGALMRAAASGELAVEARTLVCARTGDGQSLCALNEIFLGHRSHQSARYRISVDGRSEHHSSSGIVVTSGTGATGWARSITRVHAHAPELPAPCSAAVTYLVREAWPSDETNTDLVCGMIENEAELVVTSEMREGGVIFGDGVETDFIAFPFGEVAHIGVASRRLRLAT